jgi:dihydroxy-acid dehydratase
LLAIGGSTNGIIHLTAIAGRLGIRVDLDAVDRIGRQTPVLVNLKPSGSHYMEDLHDAGGLPRVLHEIRGLLHLDAMTITGHTLGEVLEAGVADWPQQVVRKADDPIYPEGGLAVLRGNLAPNGAVIKHSAASPELLVHEGRAVVFSSAGDMAARIDTADLDVMPGDILVLQNIGPKGAPGMPEAGLLPIPKKLAVQGVKDMVRISDGRMSGTASGTIVLHVSPEAAEGGPLALVQSGDRIRLDVPARRIELLVGAAELDRRRAALPTRAEGEGATGYRHLFLGSVLQAEDGVDFDFSRPPQTRICPAP